MPDAVRSPYASDIVSSFDVHKPEYLMQLFADKGHNISMYQKITSMYGFEVPAANDTVRHFENRDWHRPITVRSNVTDPGAGNTATITLATGDLDASNRFYPQVGDLVLKSNGIRGRVSAVDTSTPAAPTLTLTLSRATDTWGAFTANEELAIHSQAFGEGSGQPVSIVTGTNEYQQNLQIIKETITYTGSEATNQSWVRAFDQNNSGERVSNTSLMNGNNANFLGYYNTGILDSEARLALKIDGAALFGRRSTNTADVDENGRRVLTCDGLDVVTEDRGQTINYTSGGFAITDWDALDRNYDAQRVMGKAFCSLLGTTLYQQVENAAVEYFQDTNIEFTRKAMSELLWKGNDALVATVNFKMFTKSTRTYMLDKLGMLDDPYLGGIFGTGTGSYSEQGYTIPMSMSTVRDSYGMSKKLPTFGFRYKKLGKFNRRMETWAVGGIGDRKITEFDNENIYMRCHVAPQFVKAGHFVKHERG